MPAPKVMGFTPSRSAVMSKRSRDPSPVAPHARGSRFASNADTITMLPAGNTTSRYSTSSTTMRAVNGTIGSKRSASSAARGARERAVARSSHGPGGGGRTQSGFCRQHLPLAWMLGEHPHRVLELALRRVAPADQHVQHEIHEL